jgi:4-oxalomesaconate hydratase
MSSSSKRIMVGGAHPADPFERAGGTMVNHLARGDEVMAVSLTLGVVTHAFGLFPAIGDDKFGDLDKIKATKRDEYDRAAKILGLTDWRVFDLPESPLLFGLDEYVLLVNLIREFRPHVMLCAHPVEVGRHDHMDSGLLTVKAIDYARADGFPSTLAPHVVQNLFLFYYQHFSTEQLMGTARHAPDVIVDTTAAIGKKREAMIAFSATQAKVGEDYPERMNRFLERVDGAVGYKYGFGHGRGYGEQFSRWTPASGPHLPLM